MRMNDNNLPVGTEHEVLDYWKVKGFRVQKNPNMKFQETGNCSCVVAGRKVLVYDEAKNLRAIAFAQK